MNNSEPRRYYPFCSANDFEAGEEYPTAEEAKAHPMLVEHVTRNGA